ncbi:DUF6538 domain-containing protein [Halomonas fontilapidosi]|uniref:DUF6538 domain-containing protein n=1 Tax=Halomonas fontilapidosi TaxID=616675 RepID=UPI003CCD51A1
MIHNDPEPAPVIRTPYGVYHFRLTIPSPLRPVVDRREIRRSLPTRNKREAILPRQCRHLPAWIFDIVVAWLSSLMSMNLLPDEWLKKLPGG